jgi:hypothetical protein
MDSCKDTRENTDLSTNDVESSTSLTGGRKLTQYTAAIIGKQTGKGKDIPVTDRRGQ